MNGTGPHALIQAPPLTLVSINRYNGRRKSFNEVWFQEPVLMPVFGDQLDVTWVGYKVVSAVLHFGASTTAGHYRALLKHEAQWYFTQDSVAAVPQTILRQHRKNVYALWLSRSAAVRS